MGRRERGTGCPQTGVSGGANGLVGSKNVAENRDGLAAAKVSARDIKGLMRCDTL
jgi:hypothetical protein